MLPRGENGLSRTYNDDTLIFVTGFVRFFFLGSRCASPEVIDRYARVDVVLVRSVLRYLKD